MTTKLTRRRGADGLSKEDRHVCKLLGLDPARFKADDGATRAERRSGSMTMNAGTGSPSKTGGLNKYDRMVAEQLGIDPERMRESGAGPALNSRAGAGRRSGSAATRSKKARSSRRSGLTQSDRSVAEQLGIDAERMRD